jgi:hypothetical protein
MKFSRTSDLILNVVAVAHKDLGKTPLAFTYTLVTAKDGPGRPKTVGIEFKLLHPLKNSLSPGILEDENFGRLVRRLQDFEVQMANIARYWSAIGPEKMWKMVSDWQKKQASNSPIQNMASYCNSTFVREGKACEQQQQQLKLQEQQIFSQLFAPNHPTLPRTHSRKKGSGEENNAEA